MINTSHWARSDYSAVEQHSLWRSWLKCSVQAGRCRCANLIRILHSCSRKNYYENDSILSTIINLAKQFMVNDYQDISHRTNHREHQAPLAMMYPKVTAAELLGISEVLVVLESFFCGVSLCRIYGCKYDTSWYLFAMFELCHVIYSIIRHRI